MEYIQSSRLVFVMFHALETLRRSVAESSLILYTLVKIHFKHDRHIMQNIFIFTKVFKNIYFKSKYEE